MRSNWTWDKRSFKQSSRSQLSWTCERIACKSSTGRMGRSIWLQSARFKWKLLAQSFLPWRKTASKDQTQCLSALVSPCFNQWLKRKAAHMHSIRCPGAIGAQLSACPALVLIFLTAHAALFLPSHVSSKGETGNHPTWESHVSESKSSNMLEENSGSPSSLKYASSASNMPQIAGTSLVPSFKK